MAAVAATAAAIERTLVSLKRIAFAAPRKCAVKSRSNESRARVPTRAGRGASSQIVAAKEMVEMTMKAPPKYAAISAKMLFLESDHRVR